MWVVMASRHCLVILLQAPLQVGVMMGKVPINKTPLGKARVKFTIVQSMILNPVHWKFEGIRWFSFQGPEIIIETNEEGIARCSLELGDSHSQASQSSSFR